MTDITRFVYLYTLSMIIFTLQNYTLLHNYKIQYKYVDTMDEHAAYEAFSARRLQPGESADVFLADLRRLAALFGGMPERGLRCAFVAGLPEAVCQMLRAGSKAEGLDLASVLIRARALLSDERVSAAAAAVRRDQLSSPSQQPARRPGPGRRRCWTCGRPGHITAECPHRLGNAIGEATSAPVSSPTQL